MKLKHFQHILYFYIKQCFKPSYMTFTNEALWNLFSYVTSKEIPFCFFGLFSPNTLFNKSSIWKINSFSQGQNITYLYNFVSNTSHIILTEIFLQFNCSLTLSTDVKISIQSKLWVKFTQLICDSCSKIKGIHAIVTCNYTIKYINRIA